MLFGCTVIRTVPIPGVFDEAEPKKSDLTRVPPASPPFSCFFGWLQRGNIKGLAAGIDHRSCAFAMLGVTLDLTSIVSLDSTVFSDILFGLCRCTHSVIYVAMHIQRSENYGEL